MRGKKSARNLNLYLEIREEIKQIKTTLKHYEHINNRLVEELKEKDAIISNLQNTHSRRIKAALKRARDRLLFLFYGNKVHLFVSYLKLVCSLFLLFLKTPKKFLTLLPWLSFSQSLNECTLNRLNMKCVQN